MSQSAIIVIDLANDFVYAGGTIADAGGAEYQSRVQSMLPRLAQLLRAAREQGIAVIYATDAHEPGDAELRKWPPHAMAGTEQARIAAAVAPETGDVVLGKRTYSPFQSPELDAILQERGIDTLYITGLHTDCCARHTSGDAFQRGYELVWVTDALDAFTPEAHAAGLDYFRAWYATDAERQFRTVDELVSEWSAVGSTAG